MKRLPLFSALASAAISPAFAAVTYELAMGAMYDAGGTALADNTSLVILVADTFDNASGTTLPGGLNDSDLSQSGLDPATAYAHFAGQTLNEGDTINGDSIFHVGLVNGISNFGVAGMYYKPDLFFNSYSNGLAADQAFGIYWFPGVTDETAPLPVGNFDMGGFFNSAPNTEASDKGMALQNTDPGGSFTIYQMDSATAGGFALTSATSSEAFTAVLVPEPSAALLSLLGLAGLLRRRR